MTLSNPIEQPPSLIETSIAPKSSIPRLFHSIYLCHWLRPTVHRLRFKTLPSFTVSVVQSHECHTADKQVFWAKQRGNLGVLSTFLAGYDGKLALPPFFCREVAEETANRASSKTPIKSWEIKVSRDQTRRITLKEGWPKLVEDHGISLGYFLVFKHTGHLHFNVHIFDPSCCEVDYDEDDTLEDAMWTNSFSDKSPAEEAAAFTSENHYYVMPADLSWKSHL